MNKQIEQLYETANTVFEKYKDPELRDLLLDQAQKLQAFETMYHHFGYLLMHIRATVAHQSRPSHLQQAIERAQRLLKGYEQESAPSA